MKKLKQKFSVHSVQCLFVLTLFIWGKSLSAQWECRSHLAANLKPVTQSSNLNWAAELVGGVGYLTNSEIYNTMVFGALDYSLGNHQVYAEGGFKYWMQNDLDTEYQFWNSLFGLRELSYNYFSNKVELNVGVHQMGLNDYFLVNERALGTSLSTSFNEFDLAFDVATVTKDFSRNGTFCTNCYLYDIVPTRYYPLGNAFGDTNFAAFSFSKNVDKKSESGITSDDEFESFDDEFSSFSTFNESKKSGFRMKSYGGVLYSEFGNYYQQPQIYGGLNTTFSLGQNTILKAQGVYQHITDNKALLAFVELEHNRYWDSGNSTTFQSIFLGKIDLTENAIAMPRFSNLFYGEVFRMDAVDMPLMNVTVKHKFSKQQLSLKAQYTHQFMGDHMKEFDFSLGKFFFDKKLRTTLLTGLMKSDELESWSKLARMEMRIFF